MQICTKRYFTNFWTIVTYFPKWLYQTLPVRFWMTNKFKTTTPNITLLIQVKLCNELSKRSDRVWKDRKNVGWKEGWKVIGSERTERMFHLRMGWNFGAGNHFWTGLKLWGRMQGSWKEITIASLLPILFKDSNHEKCALTSLRRFTWQFIMVLTMNETEMKLKTPFCMVISVSG